MAHEPNPAEANLRLFCTKTQISLVRNIPGTSFSGRLSSRVAKAFGQKLSARLAELVPVEELTDDEALAESGEVLYGLAPRRDRGVGYRLLRAMADDGVTVVWCELMSTNHLTFSVSGAFLDFAEKAALLQAFVDRLAGPMNFAYDLTLGYLTAQTMLVGTGLRIRSWMHLGGLAHFGYLRELCNAAEAKGVLVELERPEAPPPGSLFILFNRFSLGSRISEIVSLFRAFLLRVSAQEAQARWRLLRDEPFVFLDILTRAKVLLKSAALVGETEALDLLSDLRMGLTTGAIVARKVDPIAPHWFDDVSDHVFFGAHGHALRANCPLPHDVDGFTPWRDDALRAIWLRPLSAFSFSKDLIERAAEQ